MPVLIDLCGVIEDEWRQVEDDQLLAGLTQVIVSVERLQQQWPALRAGGLELAVELTETDQVEDIVEFLPHIEMVLLNFRVFADGRAFSQAHLLRGRYAYRGVIRAQGDVLRDQLSFMQRCGIDQFELADGEQVELALNAFSDISRTYQPDLRSPPQGC